MKLTFKVLGSGFQILLLTDELPEPYYAIQYGMIDKEVDGFYYWVPDKAAIAEGSVFPAWLMRQIADEIDRLNEGNAEELDREELLRIHYNEKRIKQARLVEELNSLFIDKRADQLKKLLDVEGAKPYSMEELEATKFDLSHNERGCDHKFVDSNHCLKCGWIPG